MEQKSHIPTAEGATVVDVADATLAFRRVPLADATPTGRQVLAALGLRPHSEYVVLQWLADGEIEEVRPEEPVDMSGVAAPRLIIEKADRTFRLVLNERSMVWPAQEIDERTLRTLGAVDPSEQIFLAMEDEKDRAIEPGDRISLRHAGVEGFYSKASGWKLNVQGVLIKSEHPTISVRDALLKGGFDVDTAWIIVLKTASRREQVSLGHVIDLREPGIEKLRLTPREINNGEVATSMRRNFALLPADEKWLDARNYDWSTVLDAGRRWLLLQEMELPVGYNVPSATIAMEVPTAYPMAEIDMFYCYPSLSRVDGHPIPQTQVTEVIEGRTFQRWSRHRGAIAPWRPGIDSVVTHLLLIDAALSREVEV